MHLAAFLATACFVARHSRRLLGLHLAGNPTKECPGHPCLGKNAEQVLQPERLPRLWVKAWRQWGLESGVGNFDGFQPLKIGDGLWTACCCCSAIAATALSGLAVGVAAETSPLMNACRLHRTQCGERYGDLAMEAGNGSACLTTPVLATRPVPTAASWAASEGGYSAVNVLRYTPFSRTPAMR